MVAEQVVETETQITESQAGGAAAVAVAPEREERRGYTRYPFTATVEAVELKSKTRIQGRTSDLSRGGCYVDTISSFPVNTIVKMKLRYANRVLETQARVAYSLQGMGMGVEFCGPEDAQGAILDKWIMQLSGEEVGFETEEEAQEPEASCEAPSSDEPYLVLNELIIELMRSKVLSADRCKGLLQKLHGGHRQAA